MSTPVVLELRVLAGPQAGARTVLNLGIETQVGSLHERGCQLVLRDPLVVGQRVRLKPREHDVRIKVLSGQIDIDGQVLTGPCAADWPHFTPLRVGDTVLVVGDSRSEQQWAGVTQRVLNPAASTVDVEQGDSAGAPTLALHGAQTTERGRRPEAWLALGGGVLTVVAGGLLAMMSLVTPAQGDDGTERQRLFRALQSSEFRGLRVELGQAGGLVVRGDLLTTAARANLDRVLAQAEVSPALQVRVAEQVADAVRDVYRMNGVVAESQPAVNLDGVGTVALKTRELDVERLEKVAAAARRDVAGLTVLKVENTAPQVPPPVTPVVDDPGKRVASVVPGESPYVVTADGTRYFIGALLPSGHRVASITDQQVLLSKDGMVSPLSF